MKKILFALVALFGCATLSFAQVTYVATLQHEGSTTIYYGKTAFETAYNAAENGDTIVLSSGDFTFNQNKFTKGITVRGTGIEASSPTWISSKVFFYSQDKDLVTTIEGIRFNNDADIYNADSENGQGKINFIKCRFEKVAAVPLSPSTERGPKSRFYNCIITTQMYFNPNTYPDFQFVNCYIKTLYSYVASSNSSTLVNCIIDFFGFSGYDGYPCNYINFSNCIFIGSNNYPLPGTASAVSCVSIGNGSCFTRLYGGGNKYASADIFKTYQKGYNVGETFELTETAAETYRGNDGTQVGMQGGTYPYTAEVQYPVVSNLNTGNTTKEGILNVEVSVAGE